MKPRVILVTGRYRLDDRLISYIIGNRLLLFSFFFFDLGCPRLAHLIQLMHIAQRDLVRLVQLMGNPDGLAGLGILFRIQINQGQKLIGLHKVRVDRHRLLQLDHSQVLAALLAVAESLVKPFDCLVDRLQLALGLLNLLNIVIRYIFMGLEILAQNPFHQRLYHIASAVIDESKQIPGSYISPIIL